MKIIIEHYEDKSYWPNFLDHVTSKFQETGNDWKATMPVKDLFDFINQHLSEYGGKVTGTIIYSNLTFEDAAGYFEFQIEWS